MRKNRSKPLTPERAYHLIMECYQSGLSTRQWLIENGICQSTFYKWVNKLRDTACFNIPAKNKGENLGIPVKQDVVRIDIVPDNWPVNVTAGHGLTPSQIPETQNTNSAIVIQYKEVNILINDLADHRLLVNTIRALREALC